MMNEWIYDGVVFEGPKDQKTMGFVYLITDNTTGRKYIGKKLFWFKKTKQVNKKVKKFLAESDWRVYWSSSEELQALVKEKGAANFSREILHLCTNKGTLNYLEAREQMDRRVLEKPDEYINGQIQCRIHHSHLKLSHQS